MPTQKQPATLVSREVIRRQRPSIDVAASAVQHAGDVALSLEPLLSQGLPEGATLPDMKVLQLSLGNIVRLYDDAMESADDGHFTSNSELNRLRLVRDATNDRLYPKLAEIRDTFDAAYGVAYSEGIRPPVPTEGDHSFRRKATTDSDLKATTLWSPVGRVVGLDRKGGRFGSEWPDRVDGGRPRDRVSWSPRRPRCQRGDYPCERSTRF